MIYDGGAVKLGPVCITIYYHVHYCMWQCFHMCTVWLRMMHLPKLMSLNTFTSVKAKLVFVFYLISCHPYSNVRHGQPTHARIRQMWLKLYVKNTFCIYIWKIAFEYILLKNCQIINGEFSSLIKAIRKSLGCFIVTD